MRELSNILQIIIWSVSEWLSRFLVLGVLPCQNSGSRRVEPESGFFVGVSGGDTFRDGFGCVVVVGGICCVYSDFNKCLFGRKNLVCEMDDEVTLHGRV